MLLDIPNPSNHLVHHIQADLVCIMLVADRDLKCKEDEGLLRSGLNKERVDRRAVGAPRVVVGADFKGGRGFVEAKLLRFGEGNALLDRRAVRGMDFPGGGSEDLVVAEYRGERPIPG